MAAEDLYHSLVPPPIGPDALGLPPAPQAPQMPVSPQGDDRKRKILQLIAGAIAAGLGPGKGTGLLQGVNQVQQQQTLERQRQDAINRQLYQQERTDWEQQQRLYQQEANQRQARLQQTVASLREVAPKLKSKDEYDRYVEAYSQGLQSLGYRIDGNYFRRVVPYVAPTTADKAAAALATFAKNPYNAKVMADPEQAMKAMVPIDIDDDGVMELRPLPDVQELSGTSFARDKDGNLILLKDTPPADKANADGILQQLIEQDRAEGKPQTPARMVELQQQAIKKAKEAGDLGPDPTLEAIRQLALQRERTGTLDPSAELKAVRDLSSEWKAATKGLNEMQRQLSLMQVGLQRSKAGDKIGGGQAVLVTFQKILDPTSVVRESEYARSPEGLSVMSRLEGYAERLRAGGAGVPYDELAGMVETARQFVAKMEGFTKGERRRIEKIVGKYQLDPGMVFSSAAVETEPPTAPTPDDIRKKLGITMVPSHRQEPR